MRHAGCEMMVVVDVRRLSVDEMVVDVKMLSVDEMGDGGLWVIEGGLR